MGLLRIWVFICISLHFPICYAHNNIKYYDPEYVELTGHVIYLKFPGRPNYTSIKEGDEAEKYPYLILDNPINVKTMPTTKTRKNSDYDDIFDIRLVQLIVTHHEDLKKLTAGRKVTIRGNLSGAISGHHHAKILITVRELSVISHKKPKLTMCINKLMGHSLLNFSNYVEYAPLTYELKELSQDDFSS